MVGIINAVAFIRERPLEQAHDVHALFRLQI